MIWDGRSTSLPFAPQASLRDSPLEGGERSDLHMRYLYRSPRCRQAHKGLRLLSHGGGGDGLGRVGRGQRGAVIIEWRVVWWEPSPSAPGAGASPPPPWGRARAFCSPHGGSLLSSCPIPSTPPGHLPRPRGWKRGLFICVFRAAPHPADRRTRVRGHFPTEQAALKVLYLVATTRRKNRANMTGRINGWKPILNALTVHHGDRIANHI